MNCKYFVLLLMIGCVSPRPETEIKEPSSIDLKNKVVCYDGYKSKACVYIPDMKVDTVRNPQTGEFIKFKLGN